MCRMPYFLNVFKLLKFCQNQSDKQVCYMAAAVSSAEYITQETEIGKAINETSVGLIKDVGKIVHDMANPKKTKVVTEHE